MKNFLIKFWPVLAIVALWFAFCFPYFVRGLVPFPSKYLVTFFPPWSASYAMPVKNNAMPDVITQIYPWKKLTIDTWKSGAIPLWNPYAFAGTAHAANYQTAVFSPVNLLFLLLPMIDAWSIMILLQPLLAGLFMYIFLRELKLEKLSSLLGSFAFMFCGFLVVWMAYGTLGYAALFLPLLLFSVRRYISENTWWTLPLLALSIMCSLFSGHFQISIYVLLTTFVYIIFSMVRARTGIKGAWLIGFSILGILLAAPQLFPTFTAYQNALRSGLFQKGEVIPWQYAITVFAPDFYGNPVTRNDWFGHYAEWSSYAGVVTLLLALVAIWRRKASEIWFWAGVFVFSVFAAFPTPVNDLIFLSHIPVLSTSSASRIILLASFALAVLAAYGLQAVFTLEKSKKSLVFFLSCCLLALVLFWTSLLFGHILPPDKLMIAKRNSILPTVFALTGLGLLFVSIFLTKKLKQIVMFMFVVLVAFEVFRFSTKWMPFDPKEFVYPSVPVTSFLQKTIGAYRLFGFYGGELGNFANIGSLEGYDAVYQGRYGRFMYYVNTGTIGNSERSVVLASNNGTYIEPAMQLLGVKYVLHRIGDGRNVWAYPYWNFPYYQQAYFDNDYEVYERQNVYPRAFLADSYVLHTNEYEILSTLFQRDFDREKTLVLETKPVIEPQAGTGSAALIKYAPETVIVKVDTTVPKLLFLSDVYDSGWRAFVDGRETPVYRADYDFRAVGVPKGEHTVEFRYQPRSVSLGILVAFVALITGGIGTIYLYRRKQV